MPKKSIRKENENMQQFKTYGTGVLLGDELLDAFPLFHGKAPVGHPYPQAFRQGATDDVYCYIERVCDDLVLLRRKLTNGSTISIDTCDFNMLNGGVGIAHLNMDNGDNRIANLAQVTEADARKLLMEFSS
jgi:hypothetical protein